MAAPTRVRGHRIGQLAALDALRLLIDAGCATNELNGNDYGFDIHALLPEAYPDTDAKCWSMSAQAVHVQVKGGASFNKGVAFTREMWRFYVRSPVPVYVAVVPGDGNSWIELADRLADKFETLENWEPAGAASKKARCSPDPGASLWHPRLFVEDALLQSALGGRQKRRAVLEWAQRHTTSFDDPDHAFMLTLAELAAAEYDNYAEIDRCIDDYLNEFPGLVSLIDSGDVERPREHRLAEQLSGIEYLEPGGALGDDALALRRVLNEVRGAVSTRQLVMLAHRECFGVDDHLKDRGLAE